MNRRTVILVIILLVILLSAVFAYGSGGAATLSSLISQPTATPVAQLDDLENLVTASGTLLPAQRASLAFKIGGQVTDLRVRAGDMVKKGDVLARLDATELQAAMEQAQAAKKVAQASLDQVKAGATQQDIAVARANVQSAQAQLARITARASIEDIAIARAGLDRVTAALKDAQSAYDRVKNDPAVGMYPQSAALQLAFQEYQIAEARYNQVVKGASAEDIRIAQAGLAIAQANLDRVMAGPRAEELSAAQARIDQAEAAINQTQVAVVAATLVAPFDGLVAIVNIRVGETTAPAVPIITIGNVGGLRLETDDLSETNIARVKIGQPVDVTFEALPGEISTGVVSEIAPISTPKQGGTNYAVTIILDKLHPALRWGMTGHIEIKTK